ncbi:DUF3558 domain-containing protein [Streptomyces triticisoli]|uniref:DUF3558 domain-containing protein n=1 Tax=Streptomyces triticisoli TaxID=2182797 RepID=UPI000DD6B28E|nr:DUF3558 domain-containing protein [Streptomyces triticisoli]
MLRKAYVPGAAALLAALLAGCTGGSPGNGQTDNANPAGDGTAAPAAQPGKYRTLPEACGAVSPKALDSLLPGITQIMDVDQRDKAYEGRATLTYDTDRRTGCRWKVESADATDHLYVDFERVVSYDNTVSDDSRAESVFATRQAAADLPASAATASSDANSVSGSPSSSSSSSSSAGVTPTDLRPRTLSDLGDEAFLDDSLSSSGSTAQQRTVTVAFRTSNVIVTIEYAEQPADVGMVPDSEEMQDRARKLAEQLADSLSG